MKFLPLNFCTHKLQNSVIIFNQKVRHLSAWGHQVGDFIKFDRIPFFCPSKTFANSGIGEKNVLTLVVRTRSNSWL